MKPAMFRFSLLGMLGLTTIVAVALATVRESLGLAGLLCAWTTGVVWFTSVLSMAVLRDAYRLVRHRDWSALRHYRHWFIWLTFLFCGSALFWTFVMPRGTEGMADLSSRHTTEAIRIAGVIMGGALAAAFVSNRKFWERVEKVEATGDGAP